MTAAGQWSKHPPTKPGHGEPEPLKPVYAHDPPETIAVCLSCPVPGGCDMAHRACPLWGQSPDAKRRRRRKGGG